MHRRVLELGGEVKSMAIASRTMAGALAMVAVLALALTIPGIEHRGSGELGPAGADRGTAGGDEAGSASRGDPDKVEDGDQNTAEEEPQPSQPDLRRETERSAAQPPETRSSEAQRRETQRSEAQRRETQRPDTQRSEAQRSEAQRSEAQRSEAQARRSAGPGAPAQLLGALASLGEWLRIPGIIAAVAIGLYGLWRLRSSLGGWLRGWLRGWRDRLHSLYSRLAGRLRGWLRRGREARPEDDPLADLTALEAGEPQAAVLAAYGRLLAVFAQLGHPRSERQTPYEFLAALPPRLRSFTEPTARLTDAYVAAAYSGQNTAEADREAAIRALERLGALRDGRK